MRVLTSPVSVRTRAAPPPRRLQTRLTVSQPGDAHEQEADRIADAVVGGGAPGTVTHQPRGLHRMPSLFPDDVLHDSAAPTGASPGRPEDETLQRSPAPAAAASPGAVAGGFDASLHREIARGGQPLPATTRGFMEGRMGWDFSRIRVHHTPEAAALAQGISARAFTLGNDVFFARSEYRPESHEGRHLLAHELAHAMQQGEGRVARSIQRTTSCSAYPGYDPAVAISAYNCAGLALRTYTFISPSSAVPTAIVANFNGAMSPRESCGAGSVKFWHWEYDLHLEDDLGRSSPSHPDFHIVGGRMDALGGDPRDVYSKNGHRPVHGPASGPSWRPPDRERATTDDAAEAPASTPDGHPLYKVRTNRTDWVYCASCT